MMDEARPQEQHKVFSRLVEFLDKTRARVNWYKYCWTDGQEFRGEQLQGHRDSDFASTHYSAGLQYGEIAMEFYITWKSKVPEVTPKFSLRFTKWARIGLRPNPEAIVISHTNPYYEEREKGSVIPIYASRYWVHPFVLPLEEARTAMFDFIDKGKDFAGFFAGMQEESLGQYLRIVERIKKFKDVSEVVRLG